MYEFQRIPIESLDREEFDTIPGKSVFTSIPWIHFIESDKRATPLIIRISIDGSYLGYFSGLIFIRIGIRIIGSPFRGWSTCFMGLDLLSNEHRVLIIPELIRYLFVQFGCSFIEITDRHLTMEQARDMQCRVVPVRTLELDINKNNDELFMHMKTDCRNFIRQFERRGANLEVAKPSSNFACEYYNQLIDVFAKQKLVPTYRVEKVERLFAALGDTENILCLRVLDPQKKCIATSIFIGYGDKFFFWGGASYREYQHYRPNEYMIWKAIQYWRDRGCKVFDMVGVRNYKRKFGSIEREYPCMIFAKNRILLFIRFFAEKAFYSLLSLRGVLKILVTEASTYSHPSEDITRDRSI